MAIITGRDFSNTYGIPSVLLSVERQERHPACKKLDVGLLVVTI